MNQKANLLKTLIREEIKRQLNRQRINENQAEKLTSAIRSDKFSLKSFRQIVNAVAGELMDAGLYEDATVSLLDNVILVSVPGADKNMISNLKAEGLSSILVLGDELRFQVMASNGKKPGISLRDFEKIVKQETQAAVGRFR